MTDMNDPVVGRFFHHYKGGFYFIVALAKDEPTLEPVVVYRAVENSDIWVRTLADFTALMNVDGHAVRRFQHGMPFNKPKPKEVF